MTSPRKIGLITDNYPAFMATGKSPAGGIGSYTQLVAEELAGRGHDVHVFTYAPVREIERQTVAGMTIWGCPSWTQRRDMNLLRALEYTLRYRRRYHPSRFPLLLAVREAARGRRFDVIEAPDLAAMGAIVQQSGLASRFAVRLHCIVTQGGGNRLADAPPELRRTLTSYLLKADVVTSPTHYVLANTREHLDGELQRSYVVGNPVREQPYQAPDVVFPRQAVFFGRLIPQKGVDLIGRAVPLVRATIPDFKVTFIGPDVGWNSQHCSSAQHVRECAGKSADGCVFVGQMTHEQIRKELPRYAVCVLPSRWETFGMTAMEAMMWGVPLVLSDIGPFREISDGGRICTLFRSEDPVDLAAALTGCFRDPERTAKLARGAHEFSHGWATGRVVDELLMAWLTEGSSSPHRVEVR